MRRNLEINLLLIFLILGLIISSIGVTWCRYEVQKKYPITYKVKGVADLQIENERNEWVLNENLGLFEYNFQVVNNDPTENSFYVRWTSSLDTVLYMNVVSSSGREDVYLGVHTFNEEDNTYLYCFYDTSGEEVVFDIENKSQEITLQMPRYNQAFLSEVVLVDEAYEVEAKRNYVISQYYPLEVKSDYLSEDEQIKVVFDGSIDISLYTSENIKSKMVVRSSDTTIEYSLTTQTGSQPELELTMEANQEVIVTLDVLPFSKEEDVSFEVQWIIYNASNEVEKTLSANFILPAKTSANSLKPEEIVMEFVGEKQSFSKTRPLELFVTSPIDTVVQLKESLLPKYTRYSFDGGVSWYMLAKEGGIEVPLVANEKKFVMIDLNLEDEEWLNQPYEISAYHSYEKLASLNYSMVIEEKIEFGFMKTSTGIINEQPIVFTLNQTEVIVEIEYLDNGTYQAIDIDQYFDIEVQNDLIYRIVPKEEVQIPVGTYQVKVTNQNNEEIHLAFFVIETEQTEEVV